ncbi:MAG: acyl-CoA dehydrogenase, partial [Magnetococcales bacterium]|nr:acyl-CoA dehydrogenase [Magnetococcales bacterium]
HVLAKPVMNLFKKAMPPLSRTEKEALEAGSVWWDGELFSGQPNWSRLLAMPAPTLSAEAQAFLDGPVNRLCAMLDDWRITHQDEDLPLPVWNMLKQEGFFGMIIPREYGGLGFSALEHSAVVTKIASRSVTAAVTVMVPNSLGPAELLLRYGTLPQKHHYLPRLANGEEIPCFALTSPHAGSDAGSLPDLGVVCRQDFGGEKQLLGIRLTFDKRYITLAPVATVVGLAFRLLDPDHLLGEQEEIGITVALIPANTRGLQIGHRHNPLGVPFQNGPVRGKDIFIPLSFVIGGPERVGQGWGMLMECLADGRSISLPALSTGAGKLASRLAGDYARVRRQFKSPIGEFEGIQEALARIAGHTYLMDAARQLTAMAVDRGEKPSVVSALIKYQLTERMRKVVADAMDIQGGAAICMGPRNLLGRIHQAVPIGITVEGANILTRSMIIFGQGAVRGHPYLLKEIRALEEGHNGLANFDDALFSHLGFVISNLARTLWLGLSNALWVQTPVEPPLQRWLQRLTHMSTRFALLADICLGLLGGTLKRREMISGRLADCLSHLYLASAVVKHYRDQDEQDTTLLNWGLTHCLHEAENALWQVLNNFPVGAMAIPLRWLLFPFGRSCNPPSDEQTKGAARLLMVAGKERERLTAGIYLPDRPEEPLAKLEEAFNLTILSQEAETKLRKALRAGVVTAHASGLLVRGTLLEEAVAKLVLSQEEASLLRRAWLAMDDVIQVDEFSPDLSIWEKAA